MITVDDIALEAAKDINEIFARSWHSENQRTAAVQVVVGQAIAKALGQEITITVRGRR